MLETLTHGRVLELKLARPPVNALDANLLKALAAAIRQAPSEGADGLVLSGSPGMFSAGVDVPALMALDRDGVRAFWRDFFDACSALALCPVPVVAAISGHAPAGGAVLSLFCDYRIMADGPFRIGLNEVQVGLPVPEAVQMVLRRVVGRHHAERLMVTGNMLEAAQAHAIGLVDELTAQEQVVKRALHWLELLLERPAHAMRATRTVARADLMDVYADVDALPIDDFVTAFYHPQTQASLKGLVARLASK